MTKKTPPATVGATKSDTNLPLERRMQLAWAGLYNWGIFYASMLTSMQLTPDRTVPTACTDGLTFVKYNPDFFNKLSSVHIRAVLAHEVLHKVYMHPFRRGGRDPMVWNVAVDFTVNKILHDESYKLDFSKYATLAQWIKLYEGNPEPWMLKGGFIPYDPALPDISSTEIYDRLMAAKKSNPAGGKGKSRKGSQSEDQGQGSASAAGDEQGDGEEGKVDGPLSGDIDYKGAKEAEANKTPEQIEREIAADVVSAAQMAKSIGKLPAGLERLLHEYTRSKINWRAILRRFMMSAWGPASISGDYSYRRPSRRPAAMPGVIQPAFLRQPAAPIVIGVDCSGSIGQKELALFGGAIKSIVKDVRPSRTIVVYYDAEVHSHHEFAPDDVVLLKPKGGGGTDFRPLFDWIAEQKINPAAVVNLTDMYGPFPESSKWPTLWCSTSAIDKAPFGQVLKLEM